MLPILKGKVLFITGASGFLGTALVAQLISETSLESCYLLVRGGREKLLSKWAKSLPSRILDDLSKSPVIHILDGDITSTHLGLKDQELDELREKVQIVIHCASTIRLAGSIQELLLPVVYGTLNVVDLALQCNNLEKFVYVSTAYVNSNLHSYHSGVETRVSESIYLPEFYAEADRDLAQIEKGEKCATYALADFPFTYTCAKHLTERLVVRKFSNNQDCFTSRISPFDGSFQTWSGRDFDFPKSLLIIRPSILGPSLQKPYPNFEVPGSAPLTSVVAMMVMTMSRKIIMASRSSDPLETTKINEIPVDIVCNQILMHVAKDSSGITHAVASKDARWVLKHLFEQSNRLRRLPYNPQITTINESWHSKRQHPIAQLWTIIGTAYDFKDDSTRQLEKAMTSEERAMFKIQYDNDTLLPNFLSDERISSVKRLIDILLKKKRKPVYLRRLMCRKTVKKRDGYLGG